MSRYTDAISVIPDGDRYRLAYAVHWDIGKPGSGLTYTVPEGFIFDVSVPAIAHCLFNPHDRRFLKAAALHDHMLISGWSRIEASGTFHEALKADRVPRWKRLVMFMAVALWCFK
jgi:hypothetical protein